MTDITELAQSLKAAAVRAKTATEEYASGHMSVSVCFAECEEFNRLTDGPDNILALVEALENAQHTITEMDNRIRQQNRNVCELFDDGKALREQIAKLESRTVKLPAPYAYLRENDGQIQISIGSERPSDRSGGYATPWFAIYTAAGIKVEAE